MLDIMDNLTNVAKTAKVQPMAETVLNEVVFHKAKNRLTSVMDAVVHEHQPQVVQRSRAGGERMLLVRPDDLRRWLETFSFSIEVVLGEGDVAVKASPVGVLGMGESFDAALRDLVEELRTRATDFFSRPRFFLETDRAGDYPYFLRFALTPPEEQLLLLQRDAETAPPATAAA
jgi:hypothetical protein